MVLARLGVGRGRFGLVGCRESPASTPAALAGRISTCLGSVYWRLGGGGCICSCRPGGGCCGTRSGHSRLGADHERTDAALAAGLARFTMGAYVSVAPMDSR